MSQVIVKKKHSYFLIRCSSTKSNIFPRCKVLYLAVPFALPSNQAIFPLLFSVCNIINDEATILIHNFNSSSLRLLSLSISFAQRSLFHVLLGSCFFSNGS